jgi:hypothetical protein
MSEAQQNEIKNIGNLMARTAEIAEQAGITGIYEGGARRCVQQYNASVARLETLAAIPTTFFSPLPDTAGFGEVGVACAQLAAYIGASSPETGAVYHGPKYNVHHIGKEGFSKEELQELQELREMLTQRSNKESNK